MAKSLSFFTPEMGKRLRELRQKKGLTQSEVAIRLGLKSRGGKVFVYALEAGKVGRPYLDTVVRYLKVCGALMGEFFDQFNRIDYVPIDSTPIQKTKLSLKRKERVIEQVTKHVQKYQARIEYPLVAAPMKPEKRWKATEAYREYAIQAEIIGQEVIQMLRAEENEAVAKGRTVLVQHFDDNKYVNLARSILGTLRRFDRAADARRPTPGEAQEEQASSFKPQAASWPKQQAGQGAGRVGSEPASSNKRPNPRKKSLEQRLDEAMSLVKEQQLNEEAAEMVKALVLRRYSELKLEVRRMSVGKGDDAQRRVRVAPIPSTASLTSEIEAIVRPYLVGGQSFRLDAYVEKAVKMLNAGRGTPAQPGSAGKPEDLKAKLDRIERENPSWFLNPEALHLVRMAMERRLMSS